MDRGLTQAALAELAGVSASYIGLIEAGAGNPRSTTLAALAKALEVDPIALLSKV